MAKFTQKFIEKFEAPAGKADHIEWDEAQKGFGLRVRAGGSRIYVLQYKIAGKDHRLKLGDATKVTLEYAKTEAAVAFGDVAKKVDPAIARIKAVAASTVTFGEAIEAFLRWQKNNIVPTYLTFNELVLRERFSPLHRLPLPEINRRMIAATLDHITENFGPITCNRHRAVARKFFRWAVGQGLCEYNPVADTNKAAKERKRDRVLSSTEIKKIWHALGDDQYGKIGKLLILTGQRLNEIGKLRWSEVDFDKRLIALPGKRAKNKRAHNVPLSKEALAVLRSCSRVDDRAFVFGRTSNGFSGWSKCKERLDAKLKDVPEWTFHDFRRTFSTTGNELGIMPHVVEEILNHVKGGVKAVYNWAEYDAQRREALDTWGKHIVSVVGVTLKLVA